MIHPNDALFDEEKPFPIIPACDHYAGNEKMIQKALELQERMGPLFDVTCDCEDGAPRGQEREHAEMAARLVNSARNKFGMLGARVHDPASPHWKSDVEIIIKGAGERLSHLTLPKAVRADQVAAMIEHVQKIATEAGLKRALPVHVMIETHGALADIDRIAALPLVRGLDFGLMDFISGHQGAIDMTCTKSPGQFEHALIRRAKARVAATAFAHGLVAAHNVTLALKDREQTLADAERARVEFGFLRMWSIHPVQIDAVLQAFRPDPVLAARAAAILLAAQDADWGPIQFEGELQDRGTYRGFWNLVRRARIAGEKLPAEAERRWFADSVGS